MASNRSKISPINYFGPLFQIRLKRMSKWKRKKFQIYSDKHIMNDQTNSTVKNLMNLGKVCLEMLEVKIKLFERAGGAADRKLLQKMDFYSTKGIDSFSTILLKSEPDHQESHPEEVVTKEIIIEALFGKAQLYNKSFSPDQSEQQEFALKVCIPTLFSI